MINSSDLCHRTIGKGPIAGFSGEMDGVVFADTKKKNRSTAYVKKDNPPSEAQLAVRARVAKAARRVKAKLEDPALREFYESIARERDSLAHLVAVKDWMVPPTFKALDLSEYKGNVGDQISVVAKDDIGLASVIFTLTAVDGTRAGLPVSIPHLRRVRVLLGLRKLSSLFSKCVKEV